MLLFPLGESVLSCPTPTFSHLGLSIRDSVMLHLQNTCHCAASDLRDHPDRRQHRGTGIDPDMPMSRLQTKDESYTNHTTTTTTTATRETERKTNKETVATMDLHYHYDSWKEINNQKKQTQGSINQSNNRASRKNCSQQCSHRFMKTPSWSALLSFDKSVGRNERINREWPWTVT